MSNGRANSASLLDVVWVACAVPAALVALAQWCGIGWLRGGADVVVVSMAVALVLLPPIAVARCWPGDRRMALGGLALGVWSMILLVTFPLYFPGQRTAQAIVAPVGG